MLADKNPLSPVRVRTEGTQFVSVTAHVIWQKLSFSLAKTAFLCVFYVVLQCIIVRKFFVYKISDPV
jgi:hypothetical protein